MMEVCILQFPGTNCEYDSKYAFEQLGANVTVVWHQETSLPKDTSLVVVPGGFSYGDYLRTGCIASKSKIINDVVKHAKKGALVLGICNGFQILIESGLLPGVLLRNKKLRFLSRNVFLKVINTENRFCSMYQKKKKLSNCPLLATKEIILQITKFYKILKIII